jgi:ankyrin repeat protein
VVVFIMTFFIRNGFSSFYLCVTRTLSCIFMIGGGRDSIVINWHCLHLRTINMSQMRQIDWDLLDASKNGDLEKAKRAIEKGADVNADNGQTPLCLASWKGHESIVSLLLEEGADVNAKSSYGWTPLLVACQNGHDSIVSLLLEKGADVNVKDEDGWTPLHEACQNGHEAIVSLLLEKGADVNAKDNGGETPLHKARYNGHEAIVSILLEKVPT